MTTKSAKTRLGLLLHFYQPFWQEKAVLDQIVAECYRPIFERVSEREGFCFTANINLSLLELLHEHGHDDVIDMMRAAVVAGKVELVDTVAHHCIVPLSTKEEFLRQVECDRAGKFAFGFPDAPRRGFYLPEYAFSEEAAAWLKEAGFAWTVADDEMYVKTHGGKTPFDHVPSSKGLKVFLRSRDWGNRLATGSYDFDRLKAELPGATESWFNGQHGMVVIATDAETFGHHHKMAIPWLLWPLIENWTKDDAPVSVVPFEMLLADFGDNEREMFIPPSTWSTSYADDFVRGMPFPLWDDKNNIWHRAWWKMVAIAREVPDLPELRADRLRMMASCGPWWVSKHASQFAPHLYMRTVDLTASVIARSGDGILIGRSQEVQKEIERLPGFHR
jgi:predicted glycosyl hydrolase (DUF1957 family)